MPLFNLDEFNAILPLVRKLVAPTPTYCWPLLEKRTGLKVFVKHENHTRTGSFKARGVPVYIDRICKEGPRPAGLITATRGNHGQSVALAGQYHGLPSLIVVPEGNALEKNEAMRAFGGEVLIKGRDFEESRHVVMALAQKNDFHIVPPFHRDISMGVASYGYELFKDHPQLEVVYVPIGMGSGVCGLITMRDLLGLETEIVGVVAENAPAFAHSFSAGKVMSTETARTFADGIACRQPMDEAFDVIKKGCARILTVSENQIAEAMRIYHQDTHNMAESGAAAALAALLTETSKHQGKDAAVILSGGNVDQDIYADVLAGKTPQV